MKIGLGVSSPAQFPEVKRKGHEGGSVANSSHEYPEPVSPL
jgi:hypothetical protein